MKVLQPSSQKMAGCPKIYREPPNESSAVGWKSGSSGRGSIPSHPTTSTTTSGSDGGSAILKQQLEWNNNWNETQQLPKNQTTLYPNSSSIFCSEPINSSLHSQLQLCPTWKNFRYFSPEGSAVTRHSRTEGRKEEMKKNIVARFRLLNLHDSAYI